MRNFTIDSVFQVLTCDVKFIFLAREKQRVLPSSFSNTTKKLTRRHCPFSQTKERRSKHRTEISQFLMKMRLFHWESLRTHWSVTKKWGTMILKKTKGLTAYKVKWSSHVLFCFLIYVLVHPLIEGKISFVLQNRLLNMSGLREVLSNFRLQFSRVTSVYIFS